MRNANAIPETSDPMDDMLLTDRDTVIVTQATSAHDTFPAPYGQDDTALAGLGDVRSAKRLAPLGVTPESGPMKEQALVVQRDRATRYAHNQVLSRGRNKQRRLAAPTRGGGRFVPGMGGDFMPGMGEHDADTDDVAGLGAAPHRLKPKMVVHRGVATKSPPAMRARTPQQRRQGGFMPGMGDDAGLGIGFGTLALIGIGAYLFLRKRK